jgi:DNA-binding transcriptional LysR family regulator
MRARAPFAAGLVTGSDDSASSIAAESQSELCSSASNSASAATWILNSALTASFSVAPAPTGPATDFETAAWLLYPSRSYLPRKVRVAIDFLRQEFGQGAT